MNKKLYFEEGENRRIETADVIIRLLMNKWGGFQTETNWDETKITAYLYSCYTENRKYTFIISQKTKERLAVKIYFDNGHQSKLIFSLAVESETIELDNVKETCEETLFLTKVRNKVSELLEEKNFTWRLPIEKGDLP